MSRATKVLALRAAETSAAQPYRVGHVVGTCDGQWLVDYPGNPHGPLMARTVVHVDAVAMDRIATTNAEVLLVFENDRLDLPIVVGLLAPEPQVTSAASDREAVYVARLEAVVDGKRVVVEAKDEIVLRCGEASVTLRRNGRVVVRGTYVETRSKGVNRIKGGSVQIN